MHKTNRWVASATAGALIALGSVGITLPAQAAGPDLLPITITNESGLTDNVHLYVLGTDLASGRLGWIDSSGTFQAWPAGSNPPSAAPDASLNLDASGSSTTVKVPRGFSGRVYFSFGEKLPFSLTQDGLVQPAPWAGNDPTANILFDWTEFTYNDAGLWINSSQVDMFAVPHSVSVTDSAGQTSTTGETFPGGRETVIETLRSDPEWARTVVTGDDGNVLRVLAPGKAAEAGLLNPTYLDSYIAQAWAAYGSKDLKVTPFSDRPELTYTGRTSGTRMSFTDSTGATVASFERPTSADVWGCDGALHAPNDSVVGPIARTLCAALIRGTLGDSTAEPITDSSKFYTTQPVNKYAKAVHAAMKDGRAYAFAFDDVGAFESLVHSGDPVSARIELSPFNSSGTQPGDGASDNDGSVRLVNALNGMCLSVPSSSGGVPSWAFNDGQKVTVLDCIDSNNQNWQMTEGTIRTENDLCLDVAWGATTDGTPVQIANCSGNPAQQWVLSDAGDLVNPQANKCLDVSGNGVLNSATELQIWECSGKPNQKWSTR